MNAVAELIGGGQSISYYPRLARALGSVAGALFLQQVGYKAAEAGDIYGWVEVSQQTLEWELVLSPKVQISTRRHLGDLEVLEERRVKKGGNIEYRILWDNVEALLKSFPIGKSKPPSRVAVQESPNGNPPIEEGKKSNEGSLRSPSAESESDASSQPGKKKRSKENFTTKQLGVAELMERITDMRERGYQIHSPTNSERKQFAAIFEQCVQDDYEADELLMAFDYMVEKAAGQVEGEPKAWCGYRTALDKVTIEGWTPPRRITAMTEAEAEEVKAYAEETQSILANAMAALKGG